MTSWKSTCWTVTVAVLVLGSCAETAPSADAPSPLPPAPAGGSSIARAIVDLTNAERQRAGVAALRDNGRLTEAAQIQATQMVGAGRLAHELPGARYPRLQDRLAAVEYDWRNIGENVAFGQPSAVAVTADWMRSEGHRANMLNPVFVEIGIGYAVDSNGRPYYVQVFARPAASRRAR
jgi:uncharacterized protein YkwD